MWIESKYLLLYYVYLKSTSLVLVIEVHTLRSYRTISQHNNKYMELMYFGLVSVYSTLKHEKRASNSPKTLPARRIEPT